VRTARALLASHSRAAQTAIFDDNARRFYRLQNQNQSQNNNQEPS